MSIIYMLVGLIFVPFLNFVYLSLYFHLENKLPVWLAGVISGFVASIATILASGCVVAIIQLLLYGKIII